ncbi:MAG: hypothetical protein AB7P37_15060 [Ramlibacter sp.]
MSKLAALRRSMADSVMIAADCIGFVLSLCGACVVAFLGKLMIAAILAAVSLGFFLRLVGRRGTESNVRTRTPKWCHGLAGVLSIAETALLVEATQLPVRFHQEGFETWHWLLVLAAWLVTYAIQLKLFRAVAWRRDVAPKP